MGAVATPPPPAPDPATWTRYAGGPAFLERSRPARPPRATWAALPGPYWPSELAARAQATLVRRARGGDRRPGRRVTPFAGRRRWPERHRRRAASSSCPPTSVPPSVTAGSCASPAARSGSWWARGRRVRAGSRPRAGRHLGRRFRPARRAARALRQRARRPGPACAPGAAPERWSVVTLPSVEAVSLAESGWSHVAGGIPRRPSRAAAPRVEVAGFRRAAGPRPGGPGGPASGAGVRRRPGGAGRGTSGAGQRAAARLPAGRSPAPHCRAAVRCPRCAGPLAQESSAERSLTCRWCARPGSRARLPRMRQPERCARGRRGRHPHGGRAGPRLSRASRSCAPAEPGRGRRGARGAGPGRRHAGCRAGCRRRATGPSCCSTPGPCSAAPTCGPARRRCAAG